MPPARPRRLLAALTALIVGATCLVLLAAPTAAAPATTVAQPGARTPGVHSGVQGGAASGGAVAAVGAGVRTASGVGVSGQVGAADRPTPAERRAERRAKAKAAKKARAAKRAAKKAARAAKRAAKKAARAAKKAARKAARQAAAKKRAEERAERRRKAEARRKAAAWRARLAKVRPRNPATWIRTAPESSSPSSGPRFNNPYGKISQRRVLIEKVITAINSSPGYRIPDNPRTKAPMPCPTNPRHIPSEIKISVYSIADRSFSEALTAAARRCVSVQVLMNSHLNAVTSPSWKTILGGLGRRGTNYRTDPTFAHRCTHGCLGSSVLHSKFFLFSRAGSARRTVMVGSSNMSSNAARVQWNDLYTVNGNAALYRQYRSMFALMVPDRFVGGGPRSFRAGDYISTFYPFRHATARTDSTMRALRSIRCSGAAPGSGIKGRSVLYINMHSWYGERGRYLADRVRDMHDRGCHVRILYSFMSSPIHGRLTYGTGSRMTARRVLFPGPRGVVANKYSHMKMFAASGNVNGKRANWVVWTGSNNFSDRSLKADEVTLRIPSRSVYNAYVEHWKFIKKRRSSPYWAMFEEPVGGGRAP